MSTLVTVLYNAAHRKSSGETLPGELHAQWLEKTVDRLHVQTGWPIVVSCAGFHGLIAIPPSAEREIMWRIFGKVRALIGFPAEAGMQIGAAACIGHALDCAWHLGYQNFISLCEDVATERAALLAMNQKLADGCVYVDVERGRMAGRRRNCNFFGCRVAPLAAAWDHEQVTRFGELEEYLGYLVEGKRWATVPGRYDTTHDYELFCRWLKDWPL